MNKNGIIAAYQARLAQAVDMVGEPEISTADVDGLSLAVYELKNASDLHDAQKCKATHIAMRDKAVTDGDKHTARGLGWVIMAMSRLEQEYASMEPTHV